MDQPYGGLYRAKAVAVTGSSLTCLIPQIYRGTAVPVDRWIGSLPRPGDLGYVAFLSGDAAWPVWLDPTPSSGTGGSGNDGLSAYQVAVANGFSGTDAEWLASLVGPQGPAGATGPAGARGATGATGATGPAGASGTGIVTCTSTTRPPSPTNGTVIYETDTGSLYTYINPTVGWRLPWNMPWGTLGATEVTLTGSVTITAAGVFQTMPKTLSVNSPANRYLRVYAGLQFFNPTVSWLEMKVSRSVNGGAPADIARVRMVVGLPGGGSQAGQDFMNLYVDDVHASAAGTSVYSVSAYMQAISTTAGLESYVGDGYGFTTSPLTVTDVGPLGNPPTTPLVVGSGTVGTSTLG